MINYCCIQRNKNLFKTNVSQTWQSVEVIDEEHVLRVRVRGDQIQLPHELGLRWVGCVDDTQGKHLDVGSVCFSHRYIQLHRLPLVCLSVGDHDGHLADSYTGAVEGLLRGFTDGCACVGALPHVRDVPDGLLDVLFGDVARQVEHQLHLQAVQHQADPGGVAAHRDSVHQGVHKVLDDLKVLGAHALRAVDDKHQLHRPLLTLDPTSWNHITSKHEIMAEMSV